VTTSTSATTTATVAATATPPAQTPLGSGNVYARAAPFSPEQTRMFLSIAFALACVGFLLAQQNILYALSSRVSKLFSPKPRRQPIHR
jgi:hypothetical protein